VETARGNVVATLAAFGEADEALAAISTVDDGDAATNSTAAAAAASDAAAADGAVAAAAAAEAETTATRLFKRAEVAAEVRVMCEVQLGRLGAEFLQYVTRVYK
jgi:hypothetical protein